MTGRVVPVWKCYVTYMWKEKVTLSRESSEQNKQTFEILRNREEIEGLKQLSMHSLKMEDREKIEWRRTRYFQAWTQRWRILVTRNCWSHTHTHTHTPVSYTHLTLPTNAEV